MSGAVHVVTDGHRDYLCADGAATDDAWFCVTGHWPRRVRILDGHNGPVIAEGVLPGDEGPLFLTRKAESSALPVSAPVPDGTPRP